MLWKLLSDQMPQTSAELTRILLTNRHITDEKTFFHPPSPLEVSLEAAGFDTAQMAKAVERIQQAKEKIQQAKDKLEELKKTKPEAEKEIKKLTNELNKKEEEKKKLHHEAFANRVKCPVLNKFKEERKNCSGCQGKIEKKHVIKIENPLKHTCLIRRDISKPEIYLLSKKDVC